MKAKTAIFAAAITAVGVANVYAGSASAYEYSDVAIPDPVLRQALNEATFTMDSGKAKPVLTEVTNGEQTSKWVFRGENSFVRSIYFDCSNGDPLENVQSWEGFSAWSNLTSLGLCGAKNIDFDELSGLTNLTELMIGRNNNGMSGDPLDMPISIDYYLNGGEATPLNGIEKVSSLTNLQVYGVPIGDLTGIKDLPNLTTLWLGNAGLLSIDGIQNMHSLGTNVSLPYNMINDLSPLMEKFASLFPDHCEDGAAKCFYDSGFGAYSTSGNTIYLQAEKGVEYSFPEELSYITSVLFGEDWDVETDGIDLDKEKGIVILTEDRGIMRFRQTDMDWPDQIVLEVVIDSEEKNPDTLDRGLLYLIAGAAITTITSLGVWTAIKSRR